MSLRGRLAVAAALVAAAATGACGETQAGSETTGADPLRDARPLSGPERRALEAQLRTLVRVRAEDLGYRLRWAAPREGTRAQADTGARTITLFARRGDPPHRVAHDLAHEIGHAYDDRRMSDADRRAYLQRRGEPGAQWFPREDGGAIEYAAGAEDFAEVFALCHAASPEFRGRLAPRPEAPCDVLPRDAARALQRRAR